MFRAIAWAWLPVGLAACVTTYEDVPLDSAAEAAMPVALTQTIPFPSSKAAADQRLLLEVYGGVLERLQAAASERDPTQMEALLATYQRTDLPPWLSEVLGGYRALATGLRFQNHAVAKATLVLAPATAAAAPATTAASDTTPSAVLPEPPIGEPLCCVLRLPAPAMPVQLGGQADEDPTGFVVAITIEDTFVDGSSSSSRRQDSVLLPEPFLLTGDAVLEVPVGIDVPAGGSVKRTVHLRIDLMPGYVHVDGARVPVQRTTVGACALSLWPAGYEAIQQAPLASLQRALQVGDAAHFPHVFLAAQFTRDSEREQVLPLLVDQVRFGRADQAQVAMAALRQVTGQTLPIGDRQAWLAWWQARR